MDSSEDENWSDYDSGPFCRHWSEVGGCDRLCARPGCEHTCNDHYESENGCSVLSCKCTDWMEEATAS